MLILPGTPNDSTNCRTDLRSRGGDTCVRRPSTLNVRRKVDIAMPHNWSAEIEAACDLWSDRMIEAAAAAYPPDSLFAHRAVKLTSPDIMLSFRERLFAEIVGAFEKRRVIWNPNLPMDGALQRRIGKTGQ